MNPRIKNILTLIVKRSSFVLLLSLVLVLFISAFIFWKYLYTALNSQPEVNVKSKIGQIMLDKVIEYVDEREDKYRKSLKRKYNDPFQ